MNLADLTALVLTLLCLAAVFVAALMVVLNNRNVRLIDWSLTKKELMSYVWENMEKIITGVEI